MACTETDTKSYNETIERDFDLSLDMWLPNVPCEGESLRRSTAEKASNYWGAFGQRSYVDKGPQVSFGPIRAETFHDSGCPEHQGVAAPGHLGWTINQDDELEFPSSHSRGIARLSELLKGIFRHCTAPHDTV